MSIHFNLKIEMKEYAEDGNRIIREVNLSGYESTDLNVRMSLYGTGLNANEIPAVQKIVDALNELHALHKGEQ